MSDADDLQKRSDDLEHRYLVDRELIDALIAEGVVDRERIVNLEIALVNARRIGAAMGVLMERSKITDLEAFASLREASQRTHRKLSDIADEAVLTGVLP